MSNIVSYIPLPAILLLLFLVINAVVIVVVRQRLSTKETQHQLESSKTPEGKTAKPIQAAKPSTSLFLYILGILSWIVLLWPIILFLQSKSQRPSRSLLPEDKAKSYTQPLSQEQCDRISFIDAEAEEISAQDLSERFEPGDVLRIAVKAREGEVMEKARVRINSSVWTEDNEIHEKSSDGLFILQCPIDALSDSRPTVCGMPVGRSGKFAVEAEIFDSNDGVWK